MFPSHSGTTDLRLLRLLAQDREAIDIVLSGYHLCYTSRRQLTPAFALVVDALR